MVTLDVARSQTAALDVGFQTVGVRDQLSNRLIRFAGEGGGRRHVAVSGFDRRAVPGHRHVAENLFQMVAHARETLPVSARVHHAL